MNELAARMTPGITSMIRMDHSHVIALLHRYKANTPVSKKRALVANACLALEVHAQLEDEIFYPALREVIPGDDVLDKSESEHNDMRRLIGELRQRGNGHVGDSEYDDKFYELMRIVIHHVADEETRLLPAAERMLDDRLVDMGIEMTRRRVELLKPHAGELAATTARSFPAAAATGAVLLTASVVAIGAALVSRRNREGYERRPGRW
jgi:hemerythrin superfamily protein